REVDTLGRRGAIQLHIPGNLQRWVAEIVLLLDLPTADSQQEVRIADVILLMPDDSPVRFYVSDQRPLATELFRFLRVAARGRNWGRGGYRDRHSERQRHPHPVPRTHHRVPLSNNLLTAWPQPYVSEKHPPGPAAGSSGFGQLSNGEEAQS